MEAALLKKKLRDTAFYGSSEIIWTRNFTLFTLYATIFGQYAAASHFSN